MLQLVTLDEHYFKTFNKNMEAVTHAMSPCGVINYRFLCQRICTVCSTLCFTKT